MKYWWVNQNQTYDQEVGGGFLWSPKTAANNRKNIFYDNMTQVAIGDVVFSFKDTLIKALGIITRSGYSSNKPSNFGEVGDYWDIEGWCVDVDFHELQNTIRPKDHMDSIKIPYLPSILLCRKMATVIRVRILQKFQQIWLKSL
jgi:putative restriction endonuclease